MSRNGPEERAIRSLEEDLLTLCLDVIKHKEEYQRAVDIENTVRGIYGYPMNVSTQYREAKELLSESVRAGGLEADKAWREAIHRAALRIHRELREEIRASLVDPNLKLMRRLLLDGVARARESAINYGDFEDWVTEVELFLGVEPENPDETKGDLDFHSDREEGRA